MDEHPTDLTRPEAPRTTTRDVVRRDAAALATRRAGEAQSLDLVQRVVVSVLLIVVFGSIAAVLALYLSFAQETFSTGDTVLLWSMTGVIGLMTAAGVLVINRRKPYSPWLALGLLPMVVSGLVVF